MLITRREFIKNISAFGGSLLLPSALLGAEQTLQKKSLLIAGANRSACVVDIDKKEIIRAVDIGFSPHSFVRHPQDSNKLFAIQRNVEKGYASSGSINHSNVSFKATEFDVSNGEVASHIEAQQGSEFMGHGFFAPDSNVLFISRRDTKTRFGHLTGYDISDGKVVADYKVSEGGIHECKLMEDGTVLVIGTATVGINDTRGKKVLKRPVRSDVIHFDLHLGKQISYISTNDDTQYLGHFHRFQDETIIALSKSVDDISQPQPARIFMGRMGDESLKPLAFTDNVPGGKSGEMLNMAINHSKGIVAVTNTSNDVVIHVDIKTGTLLKQIHSPSAWGVVFDESTNEFITSGSTLGVLDDQLTNIKEFTVEIPQGLHAFKQGHTLLL